MLKYQIKKVLGHVWPSQLQHRKIILLYHTFGDHKWAISTNTFINQIEWLAANCELLSLEKLITTPYNQNIQVAITFDDGYSSIFKTAFPLLTKFNITATTYLNTQWLGSDIKDRKKAKYEHGFYPNENFLIWDEVKILADYEWHIGSHGCDHLKNTELTQEVLLKNLQESKLQIEKFLRIPCIHYSYPWGLYSKNVKQMVRKMGYLYAASTKHGGLNSSPDLLALPRISISHHYSMTDFKNIVNGKWDFIRYMPKI